MRVPVTPTGRALVSDMAALTLPDAVIAQLAESKAQLAEMDVWMKALRLNVGTAVILIEDERVAALDAAGETHETS